MTTEKIFLRVVSCLILFLPSFVYAQSDYVIQLNGDTIRGSLQILDYQQIYRVQIKTSEKKIVLTALQVRSLTKKNELYRPVRYENSVRFMKVLIDGYLSLNAFSIANQGSLNGRYLTKLDGTGIEVPNLTFKKSLGNYLSDCGDIKDQINDGKLGKGDIEKIVELYNACMKAKTYVNPNTPPPTSIENEKKIALKNIINKVEKENFSTKKDAQDILKDIQSKVSKNEAVPNYLIEGLKSSLAEVPSMTKDLESLIASLKK